MPIPSPVQVSQQRVVCIDPGHGGNDPGAINQSITEAEETLDIGNRLRTLLMHKGYAVIMTRTDNSVSLTNSERATICNNNHADVLVSIHLNAHDNPRIDGTQGLYGTGAEKRDKTFTSVLHKTLVDKLHLPDEAITDFDDNILIKAMMPATLQEVGYITSASEYEELTDGTGIRQQQIAQALLQGISGWFNTYSY